MPASNRKPKDSRHSPSEAAGTSSADYGAPPELVDQFDPSRPKHRDDEAAQRVYVESVEAWLANPDRTLGVKGFLSAIGPDTPAWIALTEKLYEVRKDPHVQKSREVASFVDLLILLLADAPISGAPGIFARFRRASSGNATLGRRATGEDLRERVLHAWQSQVAAGQRERGRVAWIAEHIHEPESSVRRAIRTLVEDGLIVRTLAR